MCKSNPKADIMPVSLEKREDTDTVLSLKKLTNSRRISLASLDRSLNLDWPSSPG